jgi:hypothetical protein
MWEVGISKTKRNFKLSKDIKKRRGQKVHLKISREMAAECGYKPVGNEQSRLLVARQLNPGRNYNKCSV